MTVSNFVAFSGMIFHENRLLLVLAVCRDYQQTALAGMLSTVSSMSVYRYMFDCRSRGHKFDPGPVPYFHGDCS